ncbi:hypothetical protein AURDEDRAFT_173143 [Auricularia subglabra TFB-10046 SS5]|nr:hypothetical protein AURDEDRAFT_173143 [Auricularia subglabra TFB-10046 SS5]
MLRTPRNNAHTSSACANCRKRSASFSFTFRLALPLGRRKSKCDGAQPACASCTQRGQECTYTPDDDRRTARGRKCQACEALRARVTQLEEENVLLKALLQEHQLNAGSSQRVDDPRSWGDMVFLDAGSAAQHLRASQASYAGQHALFLPNGHTLAVEERYAADTPLEPINQREVGAPVPLKHNGYSDSPRARPFVDPTLPYYFQEDAACTYEWLTAGYEL